ncbi:MAG: hypothetical protein ACJASM_001505, partial [Salibacteraceae bacterium]
RDISLKYQPIPLNAIVSTPGPQIDPINASAWI